MLWLTGMDANRPTPCHRQLMYPFSVSPVGCDQGSLPDTSNTGTFTSTTIMKTFRLLALSSLSVFLAACNTNPVLPASAAPAAYPTPHAQASTRLVSLNSGTDYAPQTVLSPDARINAAVQAALPTVHAILSEHRCIRMGGLARLNPFAVPGEDMSTWGAFHNVPNSDTYLRHHDFRKCLTVRQIDRWEMPALNTLEFRAVFYADDSGEMVNMGYTLRKMDNGTWLLLRIRGRVN